MGFVLIEGGNEFIAGMAAADERAMALAGGRAAPIRIIPAAAAPDHNDRQAGANGVAWFQSLGADDVRSVPVVDRASADQPKLARELESARFVFMLGGFTRYLADTLSFTRVWESMRTVHRSGGVIGGSSAGAMVLCEHYFDPVSGSVQPGLNLLPGCCVLPHHNRFGKNWAPALERMLPGTPLLGIDEETGLLNDGPAGEWTVYGKGAVTVYKPSGKAVLHHGQRLALPLAAKDDS
ncbi:MAG: Type 1 glutamine amidotransferase-like domain-containing protein [Desulfobacterales bacterium]|nr:Type 1 glutamine amidotransferase-like domain-containing protein [Desulfobacterales bacterium]